MPKSNLSGAVILMVVSGVLIFVGIWGVSAALGDTAEETAFNETVNQTSNWTALDQEGDRYYSPMIENESRELEEGSDYSFRQETGEIRFNESTQENVTVESTAVSFSGNTALFVPLFDRFLRISAFFPLVFGAGAVLYAIGKLRRDSRGGAY